MLVFLLLAGSLAQAPWAPARAEEDIGRRNGAPNVLLVVTDDQTTGNFTRDLMPTVFDELVDKGVNFDRAYVGTSLCCPSRAEILTGLYGHHNRVDGNDVPLLRPTIVEALRSNGYRTSLAGKYLNSWPCTPRPEFDQWVCGGEGLSSYTLKDPKLNVNGTWTQFSGYTTDILANFTVDFIESTPADQPFFAMYTPTSPHLPANDDRCSSVPVGQHRPPSYDEDTLLAGKPQYLRRAPLSPSEVKWIDRSYVKMTRAVACLDGSIDTILSSLGSRADDTLVFFISDNGYFYGEHRRWEKATPYEEAVRVPFVVRYPALLPESQDFSTTALSQNVDIAATIAEAVGMPWGVDGRSLLPILRGVASEVRDAALIEWCQGAHHPCTHPIIPFGLPLPPSFNGVVTETMKYVAYETGEVEMYDLASDPYELQNVAGDPGYGQEQAALAAQLAYLTAPSRPETTILSGPEGATGSRAATFRYLSQSPFATHRCRLTVDGLPGEWEQCDQGKVTLGALLDGDYLFEVAATDEFGDSDATPATRSFSIHATGPDVQVDSGPPGHTRGAELTFSFSSQTPDVTFECRLGLLDADDPWASCDPTEGITYDQVTQGQWLFQVRTTDELGFTSDPPAAWLVQVDTTGPLMTFLQQPPRRWPSTDAEFIFRPDEVTQGTMNCRLNSGPWTDCSDGTYTASGLAEARHKLSVRANDELGNLGITRIRWVVDHTAPILTLRGPDPYTSETAATISISGNEYILPPTPTCALDGQNLVEHEHILPACRKMFVTVEDLADGPHVLEVAATDGAENLSSVYSWSWTVDTIDPVTTISSGPADPTFDTSATFEFSAQDATPVEFTCKLDAAPLEPCISGVTYTDLAPGTHMFIVRSTDAAGNEGLPAAWTWTISTLGPR